MKYLMAILYSIIVGVIIPLVLVPILMKLRKRKNHDPFKRYNMPKGGLNLSPSSPRSKHPPKPGK